MANLTPPVNEHDQQTGSSNAPVTLVEYGDYQCPHCAQAHPLVKQLLEEKGDQVRFVYRNFPLSQSHAMAKPAAQAAEAAGQQGKFWEMHDMIFENQKQLDQDSLNKFAESLDLDVGKFSKDKESEEVASKVEEDFESGIRSGVNGTPSFFINGERLETYDGSYESLSTAVEAQK
ncbi:thioredoxin-like protein [Pontibacter ummariensis]|uniref:Thioredoxin n=1 Tax=Pontibacter ummariensis TaxID=1610492 RepID=A0A239GKI9_9BACT|nr:thioredoxin domain-containing protein [Pontibacter ummariensis]PRY11306.1 thioredoxin-like protein [Pontibacter ummariensis]SNS69395.1 Thioredoxin [Pontibacter ummariensis]